MAKHGSHSKSNKWRVVFVIALIVFICALAGLGFIGFSYLQGQMKYDNVANNAGVEKEKIETTELANVKVDWDALKATNPDTVGWLYIPNTNINYPVVKGEDNDYYLTHDFDGDAGWLANYGAVFMDFRNKADMTDQLYFIYGHHMNDGSMFADLADFVNQDRFDQCRTAYFLTPNGNFKLRTFAMTHLEADAAIVQSVFQTADEMAKYMQDKIDQSVVNPGDIPKASDIKQAFAFATCDNMEASGRYILYAYVEETNAEGLTGQLGLNVNEGQVDGFNNDLRVETVATLNPQPQPEGEQPAENEWSDE